MRTFSEREESTITADRVQLQHPATNPAVPVNGVWRTIRGFILWSHERGTIQYDIMVTLILVFVFFSPRFINFKDRPVDRNPRGAVLVYPDASGGWVYQVDAKAISGRDDDAIRAQLLGVMESISGSVSISKYEPITDKKGNVIAYKVWAERQ